MNHRNDDERGQSSLEDFMSVETEPSKKQDASSKSASVDEEKTKDRIESHQQPSRNNSAIIINPDSMTFEEDELVPDDYIAGMREEPDNLDSSYLLSVDYDGPRKKAIARLYNPETEQIYFWHDNTGHLPYCYTDLPPQTAEKKVRHHRGFVSMKTETVRDLLRDEPREMTKIFATDPLSIGGTAGAIRELLTTKSGPMGESVNHAWEANIRYHNNFCYDLELVCGMRYEIKDGDLIPCPPKLDQATLNEFKKTIGDADYFKGIIDDYAPMFFTEVPDIKRIAVDIEVYSEKSNRIPDATRTPQPVTAVGLSDNQGMNKCFVLKRNDIEDDEKPDGFPDDLKVIFYEDEREMLLQAFRIIDRYPIVLSFVGDAFDLTYLYNRGKILGIDVDKHCPIRLGRDIALLDGGIHIDLYRFLKNPSVRLYALSGAYERNNLESIGQGLLSVGKLELSDEISKLGYYELAHYCWLDANITLRVTQYNENLLLRLIILLMRISRLSMEDVTRFGISTWIQSLFRQEHRSRNALIPKQREIRELKSSDAHTEAMIKDKAFKGAIVIEPVAGVHFGATVLDFASLYPTIMKTHNISYETVDCPHDSCKMAEDNRVPETDHWTCIENVGMISQTIGFFRDTRVKWFKGKSKDKSLDEGVRNWYTVVEKALKVFVNAAYGVTGAQHFELFCMPAAESVTAYGRDAIIRTKEKAESMGVRVLYGDTDSVFLDSPTKKQQEELIKWSRKELGIDLEVEKTYKYVALSDRKKNYIGVYDSGYVEVKGLSGKKRNTPQFVQDAFREMLEVLAKVDSPEGFESAKKEIREIVNCVIDRLEGKAEPYSPQDLAFRIQMTKPISQYGSTLPQHVRAAMMMERAGHEVEGGTIIEYIKTKDADGVLPVVLAQDGEYWLDTQKYIDTLRSVFEQVLESVGIDFDSLLGYTKLDEFF